MGNAVTPAELSQIKLRASRVILDSDSRITMRKRLAQANADVRALAEEVERLGKERAAQAKGGGAG